ncbi:MAG: hypothetical protein ACREXQ_18970, partial [Polaromonas sp.]
MNLSDLSIDLSLLCICLYGLNSEESGPEPVIRRQPMPSAEHPTPPNYRVGLIVPSSNTTMETEI